MTTAETRNEIRVERLSTMHRERRDAILMELERIVNQEGAVAPPAGSWAGQNKDTLVATLHGRVLGSVTIQTVPMIEPLNWDHKNEDVGPALKSFSIRLLLQRAEGFLQAQGYDECYGFVEESTPESYKSALTRNGHTPQKRGVLFQRDL